MRWQDFLEFSLLSLIEINIYPCYVTASMPTMAHSFVALCTPIHGSINSHLTEWLFTLSFLVTHHKVKGCCGDWIAPFIYFSVIFNISFNLHLKCCCLLFCVFLCRFFLRMQCSMGASVGVLWLLVLQVVIRSSAGKQTQSSEDH